MPLYGLTDSNPPLFTTNMSDKTYNINAEGDQDTFGKTPDDNASRDCLCWPPHPIETRNNEDNDVGGNCISKRNMAETTIGKALIHDRQFVAMEKSVSKYDEEDLDIQMKYDHPTVKVVKVRKVRPPTVLVPLPTLPPRRECTIEERQDFKKNWKAFQIKRDAVKYRNNPALLLFDNKRYVPLREDEEPEKVQKYDPYRFLSILPQNMAAKRYREVCVPKFQESVHPEAETMTPIFADLINAYDPRDVHNTWFYYMQILTHYQQVHSESYRPFDDQVASVVRAIYQAARSEDMFAILTLQTVLFTPKNIPLYVPQMDTVDGDLWASIQMFIVQFTIPSECEPAKNVRLANKYEKSLVSKAKGVLTLLEDHGIVIAKRRHTPFWFDAQTNIQQNLQIALDLKDQKKLVLPGEWCKGLQPVAQAGDGDPGEQMSTTEIATPTDVVEPITEGAAPQDASIGDASQMKWSDQMPVAETVGVVEPEDTGYNYLPTKDWNLEDVFNRMTLVETLTWENGSPETLSTHAFPDFFRVGDGTPKAGVTLNPFSQMMNIFCWYKCDIVVRLACNATRFNVGALGLCWEPMELMIKEVLGSTYTADSMPGLPHAKLILSGNSRADLSVPFDHILPALSSLGNTVYSQMGRVKVYVWNKLVSTAGELQSLPVNMFVFLKNVKVTIPRQMGMFNFVTYKAQSGVAIQQFIKDLPEIGKTFGLLPRDAPAVPAAAAPIVTRTVGPLAAGSMPVYMDRLALEAVKPREITFPKDHMDFKKLLSTPYRIATVNWSVNDVVGSNILTLQVHPRFTAVNGSVTSHRRSMQFHLLGPFLYGRGTIMLRVEVICGLFHVGTLMGYADPGNVYKSAREAPGSQMLEIQGTTSMDFKFPYLNPMPWVDISGPELDINNGEVWGHFQLQVLNQLAANSSSPNTVEINIYRWLDEDFEFSQFGQLPFMYQGGEADSTLLEKQSTLKLTSNIERVMILKNLLMRFAKYLVIDVCGAWALKQPAGPSDVIWKKLIHDAPRVGSDRVICFPVTPMLCVTGEGPINPPQDWEASDAVSNWFITFEKDLPAAASPYMYQATHIMTHLGEIFGRYFGGMRYRCVFSPISLADTTNQKVAVISTEPATFDYPVMADIVHTEQVDHVFPTLVEVVHYPNQTAATYWEGITRGNQVGNHLPRVVASYDPQKSLEFEVPFVSRFPSLIPARGLDLITVNGSIGITLPGNAPCRLTIYMAGADDFEFSRPLPPTTSAGVSRTKFLCEGKAMVYPKQIRVENARPIVKPKYLDHDMNIVVPYICQGKEGELDRRDAVPQSWTDWFSVGKNVKETKDTIQQVCEPLTDLIGKLSETVDVTKDKIEGQAAQDFSEIITSLKQVLKDIRGDEEKDSVVKEICSSQGVGLKAKLVSWVMATASPLAIFSSLRALIRLVDNFSTGATWYQLGGDLIEFLSSLGFTFGQIFNLGPFACKCLKDVNLSNSAQSGVDSPGICLQLCDLILGVLSFGLLGTFPTLSQCKKFKDSVVGGFRDASFISRGYDAVSSFFGWIMNLFSRAYHTVIGWLCPSWAFPSTVVTKIDSMLKTVSQLSSGHQQMAIAYDMGVRDQVYRALDDMKDIETVLVGEKSVPTYVSHSFAKAQTALLKLRVIADNAIYRPNFKIKPFAFTLFGKTQIGKSFAMLKLCTDMANRMNWPVTNRLYNDNPFDDFASGYTQQAIVTRDDANQKRDDESAMQWMSHLSNVVTTVNMSESDEKGRLFLSKIVACTDNLPFIKNVNFVECGAYWERRDALVKVENKMTPDKMRVPKDRELGHLQFTVIESNPPDAASENPRTETMEYPEFLEWMIDAYEKQHAEQAALVADLDSLQARVVPNHKLTREVAICEGHAKKAEQILSTLSKRLGEGAKPSGMCLDYVKGIWKTMEGEIKVVEPVFEVLKNKDRPGTLYVEPAPVTQRNKVTSISMHVKDEVMELSVVMEDLDEISERTLEQPKLVGQVVSGCPVESYKTNTYAAIGKTLEAYLAAGNTTKAHDLIDRMKDMKETIATPTYVARSNMCFVVKCVPKDGKWVPDVQGVESFGITVDFMRKFLCKLDYIVATEVSGNYYSQIFSNLVDNFKERPMTLSILLLTTFAGCYYGGGAVLGKFKHMVGSLCSGPAPVAPEIDSPVRVVAGKLQKLKKGEPEMASTLNVEQFCKAIMIPFNQYDWTQEELAKVPSLMEEVVARYKVLNFATAEAASDTIKRQLIAEMGVSGDNRTTRLARQRFNAPHAPPTRAEFGLTDIQEGVASAFADLKHRVVETDYQTPLRDFFGVPVKPKKGYAQACTDSNAHQVDKYRLTQYSYFLLVTPVEGSTVKKRYTNALHLIGDIVLMPKHLLEGMPEDSKITMYRGDSVIQTFPYRKQNLVTFKGRDVALYKFSGLHPAKDNVVHFVTHDDMLQARKVEVTLTTRRPEVEVPLLNTTLWRLHGTAQLEFGNCPYETQTAKYELGVALSHNLHTENGDCGAVLWQCNTSCPRKLMGIHVVGYALNGGGGAELITQEMLRDGIAMYRDHPIMATAQCGLDLEAHLPDYRIEDGIGGFKMERLEVPDLPLRGNFTFVGRVSSADAYHMPTRSTIVPSPLFDVVYEHTTEPSVLHSTDKRLEEGIDPIVQGLMKYATPADMYKDREVQEVGAFIRSKELALLEKYQVKPRVLTVSEAVLGFQSYSKIESMNMDSSPGHPYVQMRLGKGKRPFFDEEGNITHPVLEERLREREIMAKKCQMYPSIWVDCLKDERRSKEKVRLGKTRVFSVAPLDLMLLTKMYFGEYIAFLMEHRHDLPGKVGINPYSMEWSRLRRELLQFNDQVSTWDTVSNDGSAAHQQKHAVFAHNANRFYKDGPENGNVRRTLVMEASFAYHLCRDVVFTVQQGVGSGHYLTINLNTNSTSIDRHMYWKDTYEDTYSMRLRKELTLWDKDELSALHVCGDDGTESGVIELQMPFKHFKDYLARYKIEITPGEKTQEDGLVPIQELTFLKHGFRVDPDMNEIVYATLEPNSVMELLNWIRKTGSSETDLEALKENLVMFYRFMYHYGKREFTRLHLAVQQGLVEIGHRGLYSITFEALNAEYMHNVGKGDVFRDNCEEEVLTSMRMVTPSGSHKVTLFDESTWTRHMPV